MAPAGSPKPPRPGPQKVRNPVDTATIRERLAKLEERLELRERILRLKKEAEAKAGAR
jgi:hypothetical protein